MITMVVWGFTGSRVRRPDFVAIMAEVMSNSDWPEFIIVGDCPYGGVDEQVEERSAEHGSDCQVERVDAAKPSPARYHDRNQRIANRLSAYCNAILWAFPDAKSRGTWDTVRRARKLGVHVEIR